MKNGPMGVISTVLIDGNKHFLTNEEVTQYMYGETLVEIIGNRKDLLALREYYFSKAVAEQDKGTGLIYLEKNSSPYKLTSGKDDDPVKWNHEEVKNVKVTINKGGGDDSRVMVIETPVSDFLDTIKKALGKETLNTYYYDINAWTTQYGKPTEFLIAVHAATQAPDFAYKLATDGSVDAKVHVDLFPVTTTIKFVTGNRSDESVLGLIEELNTNKALISKYARRLAYCLDYNAKLVYTIGYYASANDAKEEIRQELLENETTVTKTEEELEKDVNSKFEERLNNAVISKASKGDLKNIANVYEQYRYNINKNSFNTYFQEPQEEFKLVDTELSFNDIFGTDMIRDSLTEWESATKTATPFITKVVNHWFRNSYFTGIEKEDLGEVKSKIKSMF